MDPNRTPIWAPWAHLWPPTHPQGPNFSGGRRFRNPVGIPKSPRVGRSPRPGRLSTILVGFDTFLVGFDSFLVDFDSFWSISTISTRISTIPPRISTITPRRSATPPLGSWALRGLGTGRSLGTWWARGTPWASRAGTLTHEGAHQAPARRPLRRRGAFKA